MAESFEDILNRLKKSNDKLQQTVVETANATKVQPDLGTIIDQIVKTQSLPIVEKKNFGGLSQKLSFLMIALVFLFLSKDYIKPYLPILSTSIETIQSKVADIATTSKPKDEITISEVKDNIVILNIEKGKKETRTGGSVSWRYNNPALIFSGDFTKSVGEIGSDGKYAIFKNYLDGRNAIEKLLFESNQGYKNKSLEDALKLYAPKNEGFNTDFYIATIRKDTGIPLTKILSDFNSEERKILLDNLEKIERFTSGNVEIK